MQKGCGAMKEIVGTFSVDVVDILSKHSIKKDIPEEGTPIYLGQSNIEHMKKSHPSDYEKYGDDIKLILADPDYIGINKKDNSIEFVKEYLLEEEFVKVAVRISMGGNFYARSLYILNNRRIENFIKNGTLVPLTKRNKTV